MFKLIRKMKVSALGVILGVAVISGVSATFAINNSNKKVEDTIKSVLLPDELVGVKEEDNKDKQKNLTITLNLQHASKSIALDTTLSKCTSILDVLERDFGDKMNNYKFVINTNEFDVYGNDKKVKLFELSIENEEVEKINFVNFDYKNLKLLSDIKPFNHMKESVKTKKDGEINIDDKVNVEETNQDLETVEINNLNKDIEELDKN